MAGFHSATFPNGATLSVRRDPEQPDYWIVEVYNDDANDRVHVRVFNGFELELEPE